MGAVLVVLLGSVAVTPASPAHAAAPAPRCETVFNRSSAIRNATGIFAANNGMPSYTPPMGTPSGTWACPPASYDNLWAPIGIDRFVSLRNSSTMTIDGVSYYGYDITHQRRNCACDTGVVIGSEQWTVFVPYHLVPRLATNSGVLSDALYVTSNGSTFKLADLKFRLNFVEDPIGKLQRGYFSDVSVAMPPGVPAGWTYTTSKQTGQACASYPETIGSQEYWYLRCDIDVTFTDPTSRTTSAEVRLGTEVGMENTKAVGGVTFSSSATTPGRYVYYKFQVKIALGLTWYQFVRRADTCKQTSLSYVVTTLNPNVNYVDVKESWAVHGGRCRINSSAEY
jgi:hypothetical protein